MGVAEESSNGNVADRKGSKMCKRNLAFSILVSEDDEGIESSP